MDAQRIKFADFGNKNTAKQRGHTVNDYISPLFCRFVNVITTASQHCKFLRDK